MTFKKKRSTLIINVFIAVVLLANAIIMDFEDVPVLFYLQMGLAALTLYLAYFDFKNPLVKIEQNKLFFFKPFGMATTEIPFNQIERVDQKGKSFFVFVLKDQKDFKVVLNLKAQDREKWQEFLVNQNWTQL